MSRRRAVQLSTLLLLLLSSSCWCRPPRHFHRHHHVTRVCDNLNLLSCFTSALQVRLNKSLETYKAAQGLLHQYPNLNIPVMTLPGVPLPNIIKVAGTHMGPRPRDQICCLYRTLAAFLHLLDVLVEDQRGSSGSEAVRSDLQTFKRDLVHHVNLLRVVSDQLEEWRSEEAPHGHREDRRRRRGLQLRRRRRGGRAPLRHVSRDGRGFRQEVAWTASDQPAEELAVEGPHGAARCLGGPQLLGRRAQAGDRGATALGAARDF
ncbi:uncharacterized protein LOC133348851 isoform X2 [Lethenteron reissneri]|uniref:uncharacterized protein LOC133348851 isoform X2 n=1 Tax=Lethenteron reissneri TaxID=7753 RepID=UPI002AB79D9A|nr:uncharacterized protein LOC133348851 isoform X2 [Lethenteron reissneri]